MFSSQLKKSRQPRQSPPGLESETRGRKNLTNKKDTLMNAAFRPGGQGPKGCVDLARPLRCAVGQSPLRGFPLPCASQNGPNPRQRGQRDFFNGLLAGKSVC